MSGQLFSCHFHEMVIVMSVHLQQDILVMYEVRLYRVTLHVVTDQPTKSGQLEWLITSGIANYEQLSMCFTSVTMQK